MEAAIAVVVAVAVAVAVDVVAAVAVVLVKVAVAATRILVLLWCAVFFSRNVMSCRMPEGPRIIRRDAATIRIAALGQQRAGGASVS